MGMAGATVLALSMIAVKWPRGITYPLAFIGTWVALALFIRAYKLRKGMSVGLTPEKGQAEALSRKEHGEASPTPAPGREAR